MNGACWKCDRTMVIALLSIGNYMSVRLSEMNAKEREVAAGHGVIIEERFSKTMQEHYMANVCPHCRSFSGEHFQYRYWHLDGPEYELGMMCEWCYQTSFDDK